MRALTASIEIRPARIEDAMAACDVVRRSIATLCEADHRHDETILRAWLDGKTPETLARWIGQDDGAVLVALIDQRIVGVGGVRQTGEITLNYVAPEARLRGVSRSLLARLEALVLGWSRPRAWLSSTATAQTFYAASGYLPDGPPKPSFGGKLCYPMARRLVD